MKFIGFDIETRGFGDTYGLQPYRVMQGTAEITSFAFADEDCIWYHGLHPEIECIREALVRIASMPEYVLTGWNLPFDVAWLIACGLEKEVRACRWLDGEVLRRAYENDVTDKRYGLKPTVAQYLPDFAGYESEVGGDFNEVNETLLKYNVLDAKLSARLSRLFIEKLDTRRQFLSVLISNAIVPVAKAWVEGIPIDTSAVTTWEQAQVEAMGVQLQEVKRLSEIPDEYTDDLRKMIASPTKLKNFLQLKGYDVEKTDRTELSKFAQVPLIKAISDYKKANTAVTKFIGNIWKSLEYNQSDRVHPSCRLWNTYTGRFGYTSTTGKKKLQTGIAIHQFPRGVDSRNCITAPDGMQLVELDFSTQESRLLADFSQDPVLLDIFRSGKDFHTYMAAIIAGDEYDNMLDKVKSGDKEAKNFRQLAKVVNLSCAYRTGWKKLIDVGRTQYDVHFDDRRARQLHGLFRDTYSYVPIYWDTAIREAKVKGYAETRGGRRCYIADWSRQNAWSSESTAINFPIQGTGADMKFLAIWAIDPILHAVGGQFMLDLHDAAFALVPDTSAGFDAALECKKVMSNLPYDLFGWQPSVTLPVDLKYGRSWGSLKEIN